MKNRRLFVSIFAISLAVTLLVSPVKVFNNPVIETIQVQAEEEPITDTQRGIALLMTIMLAQGLRFVGDWNNTVQPGLEKLWNDFSTATGNAVTLPMLVAGSSLALGYIRTSNTVNNAIANFSAWYKQTFSQPTTGNVNIPVSSGSAYTGLESGWNEITTENFVYVTESGTRAVNLKNPSNPDGTGYFYVVSQSTFRVTNTVFGNQTSNPYTYSAYQIYNSNEDSYFYIRNVSWTSLSGYIAVGGNYISGSSATSDDNYLLAYEACFGSGGIADVSMEGQSLELKDGYQLESDQAKLYDLAGIMSLVSALSLTLENIDDLVRDIPLIYDTPWSLDYPDNPTYVDTPDDTIPWVDVPDSVIPADTPEYVPTIPSERDEYKVLGLDQVFPFSIPFDFYYLSQILVSEPETPEFQYAAVNPVNGNLLTIDVDLHDFDGVASIFRTCETVLFIAFLIWITRSLIRS